MFVKDDPSIINMDSFENLDKVIVQEWDVEAGAVVKYPLMDWINNERYTKRVLLLTGDSDKGKTQVAKALLATLASAIQESIYPRPYMIVVQTVEALSSAVSAGWCHEWICILLDP